MPLLNQVPLAEEMIFNGSVRWTDYDSYGDDITYRLALDHQVVPFLRMRGTYGTSFRAPDLFEQFLANQTGFASGFNDPCINYGETNSIRTMWSTRTARPRACPRILVRTASRAFATW